MKRFHVSMECRQARSMQARGSEQRARLLGLRGLRGGLLGLELRARRLQLLRAAHLAAPETLSVS